MNPQPEITARIKCVAAKYGSMNLTEDRLGFSAKSISSEIKNQTSSSPTNHL